MSGPSRGRAPGSPGDGPDPSGPPPACPRDFTAGPISRCLQDERPFCQADCPFGLDVRDLVAKVRRGGFQAAYRVYQAAVGFPELVAALCPEPCRGACPREGRGGAVALRDLERALLAHARDLDPAGYNVPPKPGRVAVVGAGPCGLALTLRLASRGYRVTLHERTGRLGGHLHDLLPPDAFLPGIRRQLMREAFDLRLDSEVRRLEDLEADAVFVATGAGGEAFELVPDPGGAFASTRPGCFLGGALRGRDAMGALADGLRASHAVERFLKAGTMNHPPEGRPTRLRVDASRVPEAHRVVPAPGAPYTREEAMGEAGRCLLCACDACARACDLMTYFRKLPRRLAEEVQLSVHPGTLDGNGTLATRLMNTCHDCGLCAEVCPEGIDTGEILRSGHRAMHAAGTMPWAWHEAFLRDLAHAEGEARLSRAPEGLRTSGRVFFPGCQLGASDPRYVTEAYAWLLQRWPDTALHLGCCGAPAAWAGDEPLREAVLARFRADWEVLGRPEIVYGCPSCRVLLDRHLPEARGVFLLELMARDPFPAPPGPEGPASVFDPCASRAYPGLQEAARILAARAGLALAPLPMEGRLATCCSYGGQVSLAHPPYARYAARTRSKAGPHPYVTYCSNCRDTFAGAGKPAWHLLDLLLGLGGPDRPPPSPTERQRRRLALLREVRTRFWHEAADPLEAPMDLRMDEDLRARLARERILETDVAAVVEACERTGRKVLDPSRGTFLGRLEVGHQTLWVEWRTPGGAVEVVSVYAHRMRIGGA